ncbi:2-polyprenyl-3-methyl-6-methoxy-1,4-benzoquinone monooxygenase [Immundisolibacter sp.]|uniref:2-polyprenyl-3-methyl-6-methoxy-1,4-benzoquinone monooxygenase n=1 Tax=Immundisolibacter sp. TaxID=1934948 RepID=UPI0026344FD6|nr:2-polyprenyl-3-methyl-6-methoxy-1,4-benzoquinone monooxygenase [Immundisolibacter sp.]MDD3651034.1 2-polyprenyl-3-methyl-6-methoxy-1,4-benzoquinone monooxygenase [Immundisolibacter sp.]
MPDIHFSPIDRLLLAADQVLRRLPGAPAAAAPQLADMPPEATELTAAERRQAAALMRVNHAGELAAQGLYLGQSLTARSPRMLDHLRTAGAEEAAHVAWCRQRLAALGGRASLLDPAWFAGSVAIGALAGLAGDAWSLGFITETERQVEAHLDDHLTRLPAGDRRSRAVIEQMRRDEVRHGEDARRAGGRELPAPLRGLMRLAAKLMTSTAERL